MNESDDPFEEWDCLFGYKAHADDPLHTLFTDREEESEYERSSEGRSHSSGGLPSLGLWDVRDNANDVEINPLLLPPGRSFNKKRTQKKTITFEAPADIEPITIEDDIEYMERLDTWKYMINNVGYYFRTKYRLSAYTDVLNTLLEQEMAKRTEGPEETGGWLLWRGDHPSDRVIIKTDKDRAMEIRIHMAMISGNVNELDPIEEGIAKERMLHKRQEEEDHQVLKHLTEIYNRYQDNLLRGCRAIEAVACYTKTRDDQDDEMKVASRARKNVSEMLKLQSKYKIYLNKVSSIHPRRKAILSSTLSKAPDMDWIWNILSEFCDDSSSASATTFSGISFTRNAGFVKEMTACCLKLWTVVSRLHFLINLDDLLGSPIRGKDLPCLIDMAKSVKRGTDNKPVPRMDNLEYLWRTGNCPIIEANKPIMLLDLHACMLAVGELNSNVLEVPYSTDLETYINLLYSRYCGFTWLMFTEEEFMNANAYMESVVMKNPERAKMVKENLIKKKQEEEEEGRGVDEEEIPSEIMYMYINKLFLKYGWNMLFPVIQELSMYKGVVSRLSHHYSITEYRTKGIVTGFTSDTYDCCKRWAHFYAKKEIAKLVCDEYKAQLIQYLLRPGEIRLFKLKHERGDVHPIGILSNLRPHDMDRFANTLLDMSVEQLIDMNIFPKLLQDREISKLRREKDAIKGKRTEAIEDLMKDECLSVEWMELLKLMNDGNDDKVSDSNLSLLSDYEDIIQLDKLIPYGVKVAQDFVFISMFKALCEEKCSVIQFSKVLCMREDIIPVLPGMFSQSMGVKVIDISSQHGVNANRTRERLFRSGLLLMSKQPMPTIVQLFGGYSVIWFASSTIYNCETFAEALYYLACCSIKQILAVIIHEKRYQIEIGLPVKDETSQVIQEIEFMIDRVRVYRKASRSDLMEHVLESHHTKIMQKTLKISEGLLTVIRESDGVPNEKWESLLDKLAFWDDLCRDIFGLYSEEQVDEKYVLNDLLEGDFGEKNLFFEGGYGENIDLLERGAAEGEDNRVYQVEL